MKKLFLLLAAAAFVCACAMPATAADEKTVSFYGQADYNTYWNAAEDGAGVDDDDLDWSMERSTTRFGARFAAGDFSGQVEIRPRQRAVADNDFVRLWYGAWNFGPGTLSIGQQYSPTFGPINGCCQEGGNSLVYGDLVSISRQPQIQLTFPMGFGTLKLAAIEQNLSTNITGLGVADTDVSLPRMEASLQLTQLGPVSLKLFGGYQAYEAVDALDNGYDIDAYVYGINGRASFGPFTLKATWWGAQNTREYGMAAGGHGNPFTATYDAVTDDIADAETMGWTTAGLFKLNDMVTFEVGYAAIKHEIDWTNNDQERDASMLYISVPIQVAKNFKIVPEIYKYDDGDISTNGVDADQGERLSYGIFWQITF